jgi:hypothetical protein
MNTRKTVILLIIAILLSLIQAGCSDSQSPVKIILPPDFEGKPQQGPVNENRFVEKSRSSSSAIESAVEISEKYATLSAETAELRQQNKTLLTEKEYLINQLNMAKSQLQQTQKELSESNNLLLQTRVEMNNWKIDILGFREEMRQADIAQLQSLKQILEMLGGQTPSQVATAENQPSEKPATNQQ